jgi:hypothetical protein
VVWLGLFFLGLLLRDGRGILEFLIMFFEEI